METGIFVIKLLDETDIFVFQLTDGNMPFCN